MEMDEYHTLQGFVLVGYCECKKFSKTFLGDTNHIKFSHAHKK